MSRTILAAILALAVAILPAVGGAVAVAKAVESIRSAEMVATVCCEHSGTPCETGHHPRGAINDCASMAVCAANCFNYTGVTALDATYAPAAGTPMTAAVMPVIVSHLDPPPFPPPRV